VAERGLRFEEEGGGLATPFLLIKNLPPLGRAAVNVEAREQGEGKGWGCHLMKQLPTPEALA
jgi:hypothetical protein